MRKKVSHIVCCHIRMLFVLGSLSLFPFISFSQTNPPTEEEERKEDYLEQLIEQNDNSSGDYEGLIDLDRSLREHPINLNKATVEDMSPLHELALLTDIQINAILTYRQKVGYFISVYELQAVPYLDVNTIKILLPYIRVNSDITAAQVSLHEVLFDGDYTLLARGQQVLQKQEGYSPVDTSASSSTRYLGSPLGLYGRFRYQFGTKFSYGITGQKDPGEEFFKGSQKKGFDFYSYHLYYRSNKFLKAIALGDYELKFGQGLLVASGFGVTKSSLITDIKYGGRTLRPYTSTNEFNFFRGAAAVVGTNNIFITAFASYKKIDGNIGSIDTIGDNVFVTSIGGDGYHRTPSEVANKNTIGQTVFGGNADFRIGSLLLGASAIHSRFSASLEPPYQPYNTFVFRGDQLTNGAIHYDWQYRNFNFFGEGAIDDAGGKALVSGLMISVDPKVDLVFMYRNYARDFHSLYANAFGESGTNNNESGLYNGIIIRPSRKWSVNAYADFFAKPWLAFNADGPTNGTEYLVQLTYKPNKVLEIYGRWKDEFKMQNASQDIVPVDYLVNTRKQNLRFNLIYKASSSITVKSRVEWVFFRQENSPLQHGFLAYQDIIWKKLGFPVSLSARFCLFDADDYDARIYAYENDVLYAFSIPAFSDRGIRYYLVARYTVTRGIDIWLRYAQTYYSNLDVIGSGLDEINGNHKSELKAEVRFKF